MGNRAPPSTAPRTAVHLATKNLTTTVGAEVIGADPERLLEEQGMPEAVLEALEDHGVLLFRGIGFNDQEQVAFGRRLGELVTRPNKDIPEITPITQGPDNPIAEYVRGNEFWHMDGDRKSVV